MCSWHLLYWPAAVLLLAVAQGLLMYAVRKTAPGYYARRQDVALHYLLTAAYFLPLVLVPTLLHAAVALAARLLLFDVALNLAAGDKVFAVGSTARTDKAIRWLAGQLGMEPEHLRFLLWLFCVFWVVIWYVVS